MKTIKVDTKLVKQICNYRAHLYPQIVKQMLQYEIVTPKQVANMSGMTEAHILNISIPRGANARKPNVLNRITLFPCPNPTTGETETRIFIKNDKKLHEFLTKKNQ